TEQFTIRPNVTFSTNKNRETIVPLDGELVNLGKNDISFSPEIVAANALIYQPKNNLQVSLLSKYVGDQFMGNTESERSKLDSYFINDLNVTYELSLRGTKQSTNSFFKSILFSGLVNNIFNVKYISNGFYYTYDDDYSEPGTITTIEGAGYYPQATT